MSGGALGGELPGELFSSALSAKNLKNPRLNPIPGPDDDSNAGRRRLISGDTHDGLAGARIENLWFGCLNKGLVDGIGGMIPRLMRLEGWMPRKRVPVSLDQ